MEKITLKLNPLSGMKIPRSASLLSVLPDELAEKTKERSRSTIQRLFASYIRRKRAIPSVTSALPHDTVSMGAVPHVSAPSNLPPTCSRITDGQHPRDLDVTMAESTTTFSNTICVDDLVGGDVTPPPCSASVPIPANLAKAMRKNSKPRQEIYLNPISLRMFRRQFYRQARGLLYAGSGPVHVCQFTHSLYLRSDLARNESAQCSGHRVCYGSSCSSTGEHETNCWRARKICCLHSCYSERGPASTK